MTRTLAAGEIASAARAAAELARTPGLPATLVYRLARLVRELTPALQALEEAERGIIERYALRNEAGALLPGVGPDGQPLPSTVRLDPARQAEAERELRELHAEPSGVAAALLDLEPYLDRLDAAGVPLSYDALLALGPMIADG